MTDKNGIKPIDLSIDEKITSMLKKQKNYTMMKKTDKLYIKIVNEYKMKPGMNYKGVDIPIRPPKIIGYIIKRGKVWGGKNRRYFELNPIESNLIKYMNKKNYPKNPKETYSLSNITNLKLSSDIDSNKLYSLEVNHYIKIVHV